MNTTTVHRSYVDWFFNWHKIFDLREKKDEETRMDTDRMDIPEEELMEFICAVLPQLRKEKVAEQMAWRGTEEKLPATRFEKGELVVWDDNFISPNHGARRNCGEGPFTVFVANDYIAGFTLYNDGHYETNIPMWNRIAVMTPHKTAIVTHPGYFKLHEEQS